MRKSIYELILAYATPLAQEVKHSDYGISMVAKKFQIELSHTEISIWTADENVRTIYTSLGSVENHESALRICDLNDANMRFGGFNAHKDCFEYVKTILG